jgi:hypothetical protein
MPRTRTAPRKERPLSPEVEAAYLADEASLTEEERADMEALHAGLADGTIVSAMTPQDKVRIEAIARATLETKAPSTRITVRLSQGDLATLRAKAQEQGLPYQTLLKSVVHQYLTGQLVPRV